MATRKTHDPSAVDRAQDDRDDAALDETVAETFPASDPPANTVDTGVRPGPAALVDSVIDNLAERQFELDIGDAVAFLKYERTPRKLRLLHTEVPEALRGQHLGETLVRAAVAAARRDRLELALICPFARAYLQKHPEVLAES